MTKKPTEQTNTYIHDLKNHVSVISLYTELLMQRIKTQETVDDKSIEYLETITRRTKALERALNQFPTTASLSSSEDEAYIQIPVKKR